MVGPHFFSIVYVFKGWSNMLERLITSLVLITFPFLQGKQNKQNIFCVKRNVHQAEIHHNRISFNEIEERIAHLLLKFL